MTLSLLEVVWIRGTIVELFSGGLAMVEINDNDGRTLAFVDIPIDLLTPEPKEQTS